MTSKGHPLQLDIAFFKQVLIKNWTVESRESYPRSYPCEVTRACSHRSHDSSSSVQSFQSTDPRKVRPFGFCQKHHVATVPRRLLLLGRSFIAPYHCRDILTTCGPSKVHGLFLTLATNFWDWYQFFWQFTVIFSICIVNVFRSLYRICQKLQ